MQDIDARSSKARTLQVSLYKSQRSLLRFYLWLAGLQPKSEMQISLVETHGVVYLTLHDAASLPKTYRVKKGAWIGCSTTNASDNLDQKDQVLVLLLANNSYVNVLKRG